MFRRKYDFKPDRTGSGLLNKLYVTKRQRLSLLRWLLYALVLLTLSVLQDVIFCQLTVRGAATDLVSAAILLLCVMLGTENCAVFAIISSVLFYFSGSAAGPYCILFLTGLGILLNVFRAGYLRKGFGSTFFCAAFALMVYEFALFIVGLFLGHTIPERFLSFCITGGLSLIAMPILYPIFLSIGKIGGESWKD